MFGCNSGTGNEIGLEKLEGVVRDGWGGVGGCGCLTSHEGTYVRMSGFWIKIATNAS